MVKGGILHPPQNESQKGLRHVEYIIINQTCDKLL